MEFFSLCSDIFQFKHWGFCVNYQHSLVENKLWEHITRCQGSVTDDPRNARATASPVSQGSFLSTPPHLRLSVCFHPLPVVSVRFLCSSLSHCLVLTRLPALCPNCCAHWWTYFTQTDYSHLTWGWVNIFGPSRCSRAAPEYYHASQAAGSRSSQVQEEKPFGIKHCDANSCPAVGYIGYTHTRVPFADWYWCRWRSFAAFYWNGRNM